MTTPQQASPLTARLYNLEYPRSLGSYTTYAEVQAVVDTLADEGFPVENTMIVGTDLKLIERVTGRQTWGRVILNGVLSGAWMGLFIGLLLAMFSGAALTTIVTGVLFGILFFTVWAVLGYAMGGGRRDFTSMTATIPMQYELMVEHTHAEEARRILTSSRAVDPSALGTGAPQTPLPGAAPVAAPSPSAAAAQQPAAGTAESAGAPARPQYGTSPTAAAPAAPAAQAPRRPTYGRPAAPAPASAPAPAPGPAPAREAPVEERAPQSTGGSAVPADQPGQDDDSPRMPRD